MAIYHFPPAPSTGAVQPYGNLKNLDPAITAVEVDNPPFDLRRLATIALVVAIAQPDPFIASPLGGYEAYAGRQGLRTEAAQEVDQPPLQHPERSPQYVALNAFLAYPDPWTYDFGSGPQPFSFHLNVQAPGLDLSPPSFSQPRKQTLAAIIATAQPDPWVYLLQGAGQPYAPKQNAPGIPGQSINLPPFSENGGPYAINAEIVALAQPDPWTWGFAGPAGGLQPYAPRLLNPTALHIRVDNPPFFSRRLALAALLAALNQPDPWQYVFEGDRQPYAGFSVPRSEAAQEVDNPPFGSRSAAVNATLVNLNQPAVWTYLFQGGPQPYAPAPINPIFEGLIAPPPGAGRRKDIPPGVPVASDAKAAKPVTFRPVWDKGPGIIEAPAPVPVPLPPPSIFARPRPVAPPAAPTQADATRMGLPNFNQVVPPNPADLSNRMREAQDVSDAISLLTALGIFKKQG